MDELKKYIREVPDFPKPGILFYDITTLIADPDGYRLALDALESRIAPDRPDMLVGIEARGFVFGGALADRMKLPFALARKPGKLPSKTISEEYELEYGVDRLEMHADVIRPGMRVVLIDDLVATGGTIKAACKLVEKMGGEVVAIACVIGLTFLPFDHLLKGYKLHYLISYDSE